MVLTDVVDLRDVGMPQAGGGPGLDLEAADVFRRCQVGGQNHLDGHGAADALSDRYEARHAHAGIREDAIDLTGDVGRNGALRAGGGLFEHISIRVIDFED